MKLTKKITGPGQENLRGHRPGDVSLESVRSYWEANPLSAAAVPYPPGSAEFFVFYDQLRERNESPRFSAWLHEYDRFAGKRVLDIGCGNGYVLSRYARHGAQVTGVDITRRALQICLRRFELSSLKGFFFQANAETLPFESDSFDCICSMGVLHHVPDTEKAVGEIYRVLKPGGRLIMMIYHRDSALYQYRFRLLSWLTGKPLRQWVDEVDGIGNPKGDVYSRLELQHLLKNFGQVQMFAGLLQGWMIMPKFGRLIPDAILKPFENRLGWFLYAKAIKPE